MATQESKMSNEQHTPGPWKHVRQRATDDSHDVMTQTGPQAVCVATCGQQACDDGECAANARLIAAAPELLEALQGLAACDYYPHSADEGCMVETMDGDEGCPVCRALYAAQAAIAKAQGEAR